MKKRFILLAIFFSISIYSQVGINTTNPNSTLDVVGKPTITTIIDGIKAPNITGDDLKNKDAVYSTNQTGVIVYVTTIPTSSSTKTLNITESGYYFFDGFVWQKFALKSNAIFGDVKTGMQSSDHNGWVKLDGRLKSTLTSTQQTQATNLGFGTNLPNGNATYLSQTGGTLGVITGNNTKLLPQSALPNVVIAVNPHSHGYTDSYLYYVSNGGGGGSAPTSVSVPYNGGSSGIKDSSNGSLETQYYYNTPSNQTTSAASINTQSINGNVTQTAIDVSPKTLNVNYFVYLGQ